VIQEKVALLTNEWAPPHHRPTLDSFEFSLTRASHATAYDARAGHQRALTDTTNQRTPDAHEVTAAMCA